MAADRRKKLTALGAEVLADALLELAERVEVVDDLVERLIATPKENIQRYKAKLADLKRRQYFISWKESAAFAHELVMLLADLESGVDDPRTGVELVAAFYLADGDIFEQSRLASSGKSSSAACVDIARVYLECGDARTALSWLQHVPEDDHYHLQSIAEFYSAPRPIQSL